MTSIALSGQVTNEAWQDFEQHLIDVGFLKPKENWDQLKPEERAKQATVYRLAKMSYKQGFVAGAQTTQANATYEPEQKPKVTRRKASESRSMRDSIQRSDDGEILQQILINNGKPMPLSSIINAMRSAGRTHWNNNNGSGFIKTAMKDGYKIKKMAYGVYGYGWGEKK